MIDQSNKLNHSDGTGYLKNTICIKITFRIKDNRVEWHKGKAIKQKPGRKLSPVTKRKK